MTDSAASFLVARPDESNVWARNRKARANSSGKASQLTTRPPSANTRPASKRTSTSFLESTDDVLDTPLSPQSLPVSALTLSSPNALLSSAPEWQAQFYRTKLCPFYVRDIPDQRTAAQVSETVRYAVGWARGTCANKDTCRFAHARDELRPQPDLRKTKLCSSYNKKVQCKTAACPFAHSPEELRTSSHVFFKVTLCNFYKTGKCWNGPNCRFAHGVEELRGQTMASQRRSRVRSEDGLLPTPHTMRPLSKQPSIPEERPASNDLQPEFLNELLQGLYSMEQSEPSWDEQIPPPPGFDDQPLTYLEEKGYDTEALIDLLLAQSADLGPSSFSQSTSPSSPVVDPLSVQQVLDALTASTSMAPVPTESTIATAPDSSDDSMNMWILNELAKL